MAMVLNLMFIILLIIIIIIVILFILLYVIVLSLADALQRVLLNGLQRAQLHQSPQSVRDVWLQFHQQVCFLKLFFF